MTKTLVVAPHPDDETLGCGGTLLKWRADGREVHWLIVTAADDAVGFDSTRQAARDKEIADVSKEYGFASVTTLRLPAARLDEAGAFALVGAFSDVFLKIQPATVLVPFYGDAHSDHRVVYMAATASTKTFRYPFVRRVLAFETLSETDFGMVPYEAFKPNLFVDISDEIEKKIAIMQIYASELGEHPFPRSARSIRALATLRGTQAGCDSAEAFMVVKEIER